MKLLFTFLFVFFTHCGFSQFYIGLTERQAISQITGNENITHVAKRYDLGRLVITFRNDKVNSNFALFFNIQNISSFFSILPDTRTDLSSTISSFNTIFVNIGKNQWEDYVGSDTYRLTAVDNGNTFGITVIKL